MGLFTPLRAAMQETGLSFVAIGAQLRADGAILAAAANALSVVSPFDQSTILSDLNASREMSLGLLETPSGWRELARIFDASTAAGWPTIH